MFERRGKVDVFYTFNEGILVEQEVEISHLWPEEDIHPTLKIPALIYQLFLETLTKEANKQGISTEREDHLKGKLEATKVHLEDMRSMSDRLLRFVAKEPVKSEPTK
jgi:hypothetical protein